MKPADIYRNGNGIDTVDDRRHVFNGYTPQGLPRSNRPFKKKKASTLSIILSLFLLAIVSVLYVSNIIAVNRAVVDVETLKNAYYKLENGNEILRSEINQKSRMERITRLASEQMGMKYPKEPPIWFEIEEQQKTGE
jgi:cell division protein FtsL